MDRLDAMAAFLAILDAGSLAAAGRRLGRSPVAMTRALALLERRAGTRLLQRSTRAVRPTEAGERYAATCRRVLAELEEAELTAAGERASPRGLLSVTAPLMFGRLHVRPLVDAFLDTWPETRVRLLLLDRVVDLIDEGIDVAVRIGHLPDSEMIAVRVGEMRRVVCASPGYLRHYPPLGHPRELTAHRCIASPSGGSAGTWSFAGDPPLRVRLDPRLTVNSADAVIDSAADGHGVTRVLSYQIERHLADGRLALVLERFEPPPLPIHLVYPEARLAAAKVRAFVDMASGRLRAALGR